MGEEQIISVAADAILTIIYVSAPPLLLGLTVGIIVSVFQTVTSIQESTLAFVPKILAVFLALLLFGPWMLSLLQNYIVELYSSIPEFMSI